MIADRLAVHHDPEGLLPDQDTGLIIGVTEGAQDISFDADVRAAGAARTQIVAARPGGRQLRLAGRRRHRRARPGNNGRIFINLKPWDERDADVQQVIARLAPKAADGGGRRGCILQPAQDINVGGRLSRTQYQYTLQDADPSELNAWAPKMLARCRSCRCCATSRPTSRSPAPPRRLTIDRDAARALRHPAAADRRHAVRRVRPAPGDAVFHPAQLLPRDPGGAAAAARAISRRCASST